MRPRRRRLRQPRRPAASRPPDKSRREAAQYSDARRRARRAGAARYRQPAAIAAARTTLTLESVELVNTDCVSRLEADLAAFERQAIGRVRRYPQQRPVRVCKLVCAGTVEQALGRGLY